MKKVELDWKNPITTPPEPFASVLVYMPCESPLPTVREGYMADDGLWWAGGFLRHPDEIAEWADMPQRE